MAERRLVRRWRKWQAERDAAGWGTRPTDLDMGLVQDMVASLRPLFGEGRAYFPTTVSGWDNLPAPGALLIANHSGGTTIPDVWGLGAAWYRHFGTERPVHALAHEMVFATEGTGRFFAQRGILRANRENARRILSEHHRDLLVLPGGDLDTWRPWKDRYKVNFAGRKGYAVTAIRNQVPIVPVAHAGAHDTLIVLTDGRRLAARLRFPELFRAKVFPVHMSLPFGIGIGPLPHLPPPTRLRYRFGKAIHPPVLREGEEITQKMVDDLDFRVRHALQCELDVLRDEADGVLDRVQHVVRRARTRIKIRRPRGRRVREEDPAEEAMLAMAAK
ncbi:MAG: 1-acyl-sn-glycerol-3-phosphate acyltransferase [Proteobacteria bacterium]|nr:1-acyl-sn-glycerol-3-phosphate acyltransferase [Pseudomonadota bacterium]